MPRDWIFLECKVCGERYYRTSKNTKTRTKIEIKKFCRRCKKHTKHKERRK